MRFTNDERGQGLVEYALVLVLIAIVVIVILSLLGPQIGGVYARVMGGLNRQVVSGVGPQAVVLSQPAITPRGGLCDYSVQDVTVIVLDDGRGVPNTSVRVRMLLNGGQIAFAIGTTNGAGIVSSPMSLIGTDVCNGSVSYSWSYE